ncbi:NAD+ synthase [Natronolimnobius sp. AArcel1]|uniref:NAD+ synthase n=1 Tax=Natronolimnobius sp. AArcel1 TaxID=1679093 RepID=UPI0013EBD958|nr:NAD+ synthase [Natronolimnobius sp. AArcel1]NGM68312.1 NAD+ synthase [Natronolimnobius sp. AArcel1]
MGAESKTFVYPGCGVQNGPFVTADSDLEEVRERIIDDIRATVDDAGATGVVVAMSGGIDSTVTAALAVEALGGEHVLGLGLPCHKADQAHVSDARTIADGLGIEFQEIHLRPLLEAFKTAVDPALETGRQADTTRPVERNDALGNVTARLRMVCAYYAANRRSRLVLGTANRSEFLLGYFTKYGDGAADTYPIGDLYKTEVRALAGRIGVPRRIVSKEPTAGFWADQTDATELGASYDAIDPFLHQLFETDTTVSEAATNCSIDLETARSLAWRSAETAHKRAQPPTPGVVDRSDSSAEFGCDQ